MTTNLRSMGLGEILDRTFQIYRSRFWLFVCISSVPVFAWELIFFINTNWLQTHTLDHSSGNTGILLWNFVASHVNYYAFFLVALLAMPAVVKVTECSFLGTKCTALSSLGFAVAFSRRCLWIAFLVASVFLVLDSAFRSVVAWIFVDSVSTLGRSFNWAAPILNAFATVAGWALFLWLFARLSFAIPAAVIEDLPSFRSLRRSWILTRDSWQRICLALVALILGLWASTWVLEFSLGRMMYFIGDVLHISDAMRNLYPAAVFVVGTAVYVLLGPIYPIVITLFYYDQRIRREGYDIEMMMKSAGLDAPTALTVKGSPITPAAEEEVQP